jgi:hypothetical protein
LRRLIRHGHAPIISTDYDAVYAYHLREVGRSRTHGSMRDASGGSDHASQGIRTKRKRAGKLFRRSVPDRNRTTSVVRLRTDLRNHRAIIQPRLYDYALICVTVRLRNDLRNRRRQKPESHPTTPIFGYVGPYLDRITLSQIQVNTRIYRSSLSPLSVYLALWTPFLESSFILKSLMQRRPALARRPLQSP